jgi:tetratricopeptide (TPR) repeat protein
MTLRTLGELELAAGRLDHADRYLTEALTIFQTQDASLFVARTLRDMACLREAQGEHAQAQLVRKEAVEIFESFGAREFEELTA